MQKIVHYELSKSQKGYNSHRKLMRIDDTRTSSVVQKNKVILKFQLNMSKYVRKKCGKMCFSSILGSKRDITPTNIDAIRHIAITICPFRFAFSHLPKCGQLLRQKHRNNFTWSLCARFSLIFRFQQVKPIRIINLQICLDCWIP